MSESLQRAARLFFLLIYPIVLGKGLRCFKDGASAKLKLKEEKRYGEVVLATYEPAR